MQEDTSEELVQRIEFLERLNKELLQTLHETERLEFGWTGNLGQWFWDFPTNDVTFNPLKAEALGFEEEDFPEKVPYQFFTDRLHPDDKDEVMELMTKHLKGEIPIWEVKYRIQAKDGSWKVYQDRGKVTKRGENGEPIFLKGIVFDVTQEEEERQQLKDKNEYLSSQKKRDPLTSLYTRPAITLELVRRAKRAKENELPMSLIVLKVDKYSTYEEEFGIVISEDVLKVTGHLIQSAILDEPYIAGRYTESVFIILLEDTQAEEAYAVAETIRHKALETLFGVPRPISISAGVSVLDPKESISELVQQTAKKLAAAQKKGGNQTVL